MPIRDELGRCKLLRQFLSARRDSIGKIRPGRWRPVSAIGCRRDGTVEFDRSRANPGGNPIADGIYQGVGADCGEVTDIETDNHGSDCTSSVLIPTSH